MLPADIRESIAIGSVNAVGGQPSSLANLTYANTIANTNLSQQNTVANQQSINQVGVSVLGKAVNLVSDLSPLEAVAVVKMDTGNDVAEQIADLKAAVSGFGGGRPAPGPAPTPKPKPSHTVPRLEKNKDGQWEVIAKSSDLPIKVKVIDTPAG